MFPTPAASEVAAIVSQFGAVFVPVVSAVVGVIIATIIIKGIVSIWRGG